MTERNRVLFSERCRALAQECRTRAQSFHDNKQRMRMLQLAEDYVRKAQQAAELEATLLMPPVQAPSLIPQIAETFVSRMKAENKKIARRAKKPRKRRARKSSAIGP